MDNQSHNEKRPDTSKNGLGKKYPQPAQQTARKQRTQQILSKFKNRDRDQE